MAISLTIIIPTFNRPHFARRAVESVLSKSYFCGQIILVNDGSHVKHDDQYNSIVKDFSDRIVYVRNRQSMGVSGARNIGAEHVKTNWILFLDDDDEILEGYIQEASEAALHDFDIDAFWCNIKVQTSTESQSYRTFIDSNCTDKIIYQALKIGASYGLLVKLSVFRALSGFDCSLKVGEDTDFIIRLIYFGYRLKPISYFGILKHEEVDARLSFSYARYSEEKVYELLLERYADFWSKRLNAKSNILLWCVYIHISNGNFDSAVKLLPELMMLTDEIALSS